MNKYRNKQTVVRGHVFDSIAESQRYLELSQWEKEGKINNLRLQPVYILQDEFVDNQGKKHRPITYLPDFDYFDKFGRIWVEDVKGMKTEVYKLKKKLLLHKFKTIVFREI